MDPFMADTISTSNIMTLDFTLSKFRSLCCAVAQYYPAMTLAEYFKAKNLPPRFAMMRHDIDRKPMRALNTARVEQEMGNKATVVHKGLRPFMTYRGMAHTPSFDKTFLKFFIRQDLQVRKPTGSKESCTSSITSWTGWR